jgi:hypothetical protein
LKDPGQDKEYLLRRLTHRKRLMGRIPMKKECLKEKREIPMGDEKHQNDGHALLV